MTSVLNAYSFPHIVDAIFEYALEDDVEPAWLLAAGAVCRAWHAGVNRKIGHHLLSAGYAIHPEDERYAAVWDAAHDTRNKFAGFVAATGPVDPDARWHRTLEYPHGGGSGSEPDSADDGYLEYDVLRPALYPGRDVGDMDTRAAAPLVREARVLTAATWIFTPAYAEALAALCPRLRTVRLASFAPAPRPTPARVLPAARTFVWFRAPDTHFNIYTASPGWRARSRPARPRVCHADTTKLVFVNHALPPRPGRDGYQPPADVAPPVVRPERVEEVVFVLPGAPADGIERWMRWSVDCRFRTTLVLAAEDLEKAREALQAVAGALLAHERVEVLTADAYRARVGEETFREETEYYLSPTERANEEQNETLDFFRPEWRMPWRE